MRPKRWLTVALVVLIVVALAGSAIHARRRIRVSRHALGALAFPDACLVLPGFLSPVAATPIEAPVRDLAVPLNSHVTKGAERATETSCANAGMQFQESQMPAARYNQAVQTVGSARAAAGATPSQAEADASAVTDATMRRQEARVRLAETERQWQFALPATRGVRRSGQLALVSPADGLLVARDPDAGTFGISSDPSAMRVQVQMPADELPRLRISQPA